MTIYTEFQVKNMDSLKVISSVWMVVRAAPEEGRSPSEQGGAQQE